MARKDAKLESIKARFEAYARTLAETIRRVTGVDVDVDVGALEGEEIVIFITDENAASVRAFLERNFAQVGRKVVRQDSMDGDVLIAIGE